VQIFTSRYSNKRVGELAAEGLILPVGITRGSPRFQLNYQIVHNEMALAPTSRTFVMNDKAVFWPEMLKDLAKVDAPMMFRKLADLASAYNKPDVVLLCFEDVYGPPPKDWCHRQVVAEWFHDTIGIDVVELDDPGPSRKPRNRSSSDAPGMPGTPLQPSLFDDLAAVVDVVASSQEGLAYAIRVATDGHLYCHCWSYMTRKVCRHLTATLEMLDGLEAEGAA
jgi:hypothetical protein